MKTSMACWPFTGAVLKSLLIILGGVLILLPTHTQAQLATATINGVVRDTSGAVIPQATVTLINMQTGVKRSVETNQTGNYVIQDIDPGTYRLEVSKSGFTTQTQKAFTLYVNQTATYDFTLSVGSPTQTVTVEAAGAALETSTSELGEVVGRNEVNDLPLNGRNFTQILSLTPGVSTVNVSQNSTTTGGIWSNPIGEFSYPSVNGQTNRSNLFLLDGVYDQGSFGSTYAIAPILDQVQEFKVQSHNDAPQFGGALGGIINVVTKAGGNDFHGDAWEFVRNTAFDARNTFLANRIPFEQNQFGGAIGGPVILPHYNGRNRTFFYAAYEGYRNHTTSSTLFKTVTPAELTGDFSDSPTQIYNPFSTRPNPASPGEFIRDPFPGNQIPQSLLSPGMVLFAKTLFPAPVTTSNPAFNGLDTTPTITRQDTASLRLDEQFGAKDSAWARYTGFTQPVTGSGGYTGLVHKVFTHGYNVGATWVHTFSGTSVMTLEFGRDSGNINQFTRFVNASPTFWQQVGFSPNFAGNFIGGFSTVPSTTVVGFLGSPDPSAHGASAVDETHFSNIYQFRGDYSKIHGHHTFMMGGDIATNNADALYLNPDLIFDSFPTTNPLSTAGTGNAMASLLLGLPSNAGRRDVRETEHGGWVDGFYFWDQWKATSKFTLNLGFRYDLTLLPIYGSASAHNLPAGDLDWTHGQYILTGNAPSCDTAKAAPCIPGGQLPAHVVITPLSNGAIYHNNYDNWQPRIGMAYRLRPRTVLRASAGRFFDNWAADTQTGQNYEGSWPSIGQLLASNLNATVPNATAFDPFNLGSGAPLPAPTPFNQVQWFMSPYAQRPYSDQWNFGVQQMLGQNTVLTANYVGSHSSRLDVGGFVNVAVTPGPGDAATVASREPYPYITPTFFDQSIGRSSYNAFQFSLSGRSTHGLNYLISYTWSKTIDIGCSGWYGVEGCSIENPYDLNANKSVAGFDVPQIFSAAWVYELPFGKGQKFSTGSRVADAIVGNWQLNGILSLSSGSPYDVGVSGDIANTGMSGCCSGYYERLNYLGGPKTEPNPTPTNWINASAFAIPARYTFGNLGRNTLRSDAFKNLDLSLFREFPITESKRLEFRFEMFNSTNVPIYAIPDHNISDPTFGQVSSLANSPRQIQFALKFYF